MNRVTWKLSALVTLLCLTGCQSNLIRGERAPGKVDAVAQNLSTGTGVGWFVAEKASLVTPESSRPVSADPYAAIRHYEALLAFSQEPALRAEAMRRAAYLRVRLVDTGETDNLALLDEALALYAQLFAEQPQASGNDLARYQQARALHILGRSIEAAEALDRLTADYPTSALYADAAFRAGELFYIERHYAEAAQSYAAAVAALPADAELKDVAQYRVGWAQLQSREYPAAAAAFVTLLERLLPAGDALSQHEATLAKVTPAQRELTRDALRGASLAFLNWGAIPPPAQTWDGQAATAAHAPTLYSALGELMRERQRFTDAATTYAAFAEHYPGHAHAPEFQERVIATYRDGGFGELEVAARETYATRYAPQAAYWAGQSPSDEFVAGFRSHLLTLAQYRHALAQQAEVDSPARLQAFEAAAHWYQETLALMPEADDAVEIRMLYADALFDGNRMDAAAAQYHALAYEHERHSRSEEAAMAAVQAYQRLSERQPPAQKADAQRQVITASLMLAETYPEHPGRATVMLGAAETAFDLGQHREALEIAEALLQLDPPPATRQDATAVMADSQFALADYAAAEQTYLSLRASLGRGDARLGAVTEQLASAIFKQGDVARDESRWADAAAAFGRILTLAPSSQRRPDAAFDTGVMHLKAEAWAEAAAAFEAFRRRHPDHGLVADADKWLTTAYVQTGQRGRAAQAFERVAARDSEAADIREEAAWQAARLYHEAGEYRAAGPAYQRYLQRSGIPLDRGQEARLHLADLAREREGNPAMALHWMKEILSADQAAGRARSPLSASLAAQANLLLGRDSAARAKRIALRAPVEASLRERMAAVTTSINHLSAAIEAGYADIITEATYEMASVYLDLSAALLASEHPPELDGAALQEYVLYVEEQAYPMEERAIGMHERNLALLSGGHWDEWIQGSAQVLTKMMPAQYGKREQREDHYASLQ